MKKLLTFTIALMAVLIVLSISVFAQDGNVAKVGDTEYATLQEAIDAAGEGDTVTLLQDLTFESNYNNAALGIFNIKSDDVITIDLNGKTIDVTDNSSGNFIVFYNYGELTIKNGTVKMTSTIDRFWNAQSTVILNRGGNLVIESGNYIHNGGTAMAITVDNSANSFGDAYLTVKGGSISSTYTGIRMRMADPSLNGNPGNGTATIVMTGGTVHGNSNGIWGQITNASSQDLGTFNIEGGTVSGGNAIRVTTDSYDNIDVTITGDAVLDGKVVGESADFAISGGTFTQEVDSSLFADGFAPIENGDGTFGVGVTLASAFKFLGYSVRENDKTAIAAGYSVDHSIIATYCQQNDIESFDFGCAFGIGGINEKTLGSFAGYTSFSGFDVKIQGIDPSNEKHTTAQLAMALYVNCGNGYQYVVEIDGAVAIVDASQVPTVTFASYVE